jgi:hypothetical protein
MVYSEEVNSMGIEDEIRALFSQGYTPQSILSSQPYKKSTVYKVYRELSTRQAPVAPPQWYVNVSPHPETKRYLPGGLERFTCDVRNNAPMDLYVTSSGMQPEWLRGQWHINPERFLLRPGESRSLRIDLPIPQDIALGEYELRFGIEGQYLGQGGISNLSAIQWAEPFALQVKCPRNGYKLFLSHSVKDLNLVRQVEKQLDADGIEVFIAEDISTPGAILNEKFQALIRGAHFFLALLTENGARSEWVATEVNYAHQINKPMLVLKEREAQVGSLSREWVEFSRYDSYETILDKIRIALNQLQGNPTGAVTSGTVHPLVWVGLGLFFGAILANSGKSQTKYKDTGKGQI